MSNPLINFLLKQREHTWEKESWFTPVLPGLKQVSSKEAVWRPDHGRNSIWQIDHHMNYYNRLILSRIKADPQHLA